MKRLKHRLKWSLVTWVIVLAFASLIFNPATPALKIQPERLRAEPFSLAPLPALPIAELPTDLSLTAKSYIAIDAASGEILLSKNAKLKLPPASTVKLLLSWVARKACPLNQVTKAKSAYPVGTVIGLSAGEEFQMVDLLKASLIPSANDAAMTLAEGCFGSGNAAVDVMNRRLAAWHLADSRVTNPTGLDQEGGYTTATDLARLAILATSDSVIAEITGTSQTAITNVDGTKTYYLYSTNKLLGTLGINGIKTGQTEQALENLIASSTQEHRVITVVLGSTDRFGDTIALLTEVRRIYRWQVDPYRSLGTSLRDAYPIK